jgi:hypothetical protein
MKDGGVGGAAAERENLASPKQRVNRNHNDDRRPSDGDQGCQWHAHEAYWILVRGGSLASSKQWAAGFEPWSMMWVSVWWGGGDNEINLPRAGGEPKQMGHFW